MLLNGILWIVLVKDDSWIKHLKNEKKVYLRLQDQPLKGPIHKLKNTAFKEKNPHEITKVIMFISQLLSMCCVTNYYKP